MTITEPIPRSACIYCRHPIAYVMVRRGMFNWYHCVGDLKHPAGPLGLLCDPRNPTSLKATPRNEGAR